MPCWQEPVDCDVHCTAVRWRRWTSLDPLDNARRPPAGELSFMANLRVSLSMTILALALALPGGAFAQSTDTQTQDQQNQDQQNQAQQPVPAVQPVDPTAPPAVDSPECAWIGQRILMLLWRDDIDTAKDFEEIYDRFGCPQGHEAPAFRCLVQIGVNPEEADPGLPERAKACWANPALDPTSFLPPQQATPTPQ